MGGKFSCDPPSPFRLSEDFGGQAGLGQAMHRPQLSAFGTVPCFKDRLHHRVKSERLADLVHLRATRNTKRVRIPIVERR